MKTAIFTAAAIGIAAMGATGAAAQGMPMGEELYGQTVQVRSADGTVNTIRFMSDGNAVISGPNVSPVNAKWGVSGNQLCLQAGGASECWNYSQRFQANRPVSLASSCNTTAQWTALGVAPTQVAEPVLRERG
ncbi:hypothetical protein ACFCW2_00765 [Qipengyuania sp. DSG2-2]|uniref:hypothetical protein n=1 Tax=Qipengyuania sp. DGS2-2 TaxID=3349631 RepID=UPI0036D2B77E